MAEKHTPGPWKVFIDDSGDEWTGWPLSIYAENDEDKSIVRPGGQWPYKWDAAMSQREAVANAHLIAAAPDLLAALKAFLHANREMQDYQLTKEESDARQLAFAAIARVEGAKS